MSLLKQIIPDLYLDLFPATVLKKDVTETKATCDNCLRARDKRFPYPYDPKLKCCTFFPFLPNYAIGGILKENLPGADVILENIKKRKFTLPLGAFPDLEYQHKFFHKKKTDFGNREDLMCPYYNHKESNCGIWKYRGVVCTTFFCRSDRGETGQTYWTNLNNFLSYVEMALAEECLVQLDFSPRDMSDQLDFLNRKEWTKSEMNQTSLDPKEYKLFWNGYTDEKAFYLKCYDLVRKMTKEEFKEILGSQHKTLVHPLK